MTNNINIVFEGRKTDLETEKQNDIRAIKSENSLEMTQTSNKISEIRNEKSILEYGNQQIGEKGLLQINKEIEQNKLEDKTLEQSFVVTKFASIGIISALIFLLLCMFYLSIFIATSFS